MRRWALPAGLLVALLGYLPGGAGLIAAGPATATCARAADAYHIALVTEHEDTRTLRLCVSAAQANPTGEQILQMARAQWGVQYQTFDYGGSLGRAVCQIDNEPATPAGGFTRDNCLRTGDGYWAVYHARPGGAWSGSAGVSNEVYADQDAEGFHYAASPTPPPSPAGICPAPTPAPANSASARPESPPPGRRAQPTPTTPPQPPTPPVSAHATDTAASPSTAAGPLAAATSASPALPRSAPAAGAAGKARESAVGWLAAGGAALAIAGLLVRQMVLRNRN